LEIPIIKTIPKFICTCSKQFVTQSGLWKHKQRCLGVSTSSTMEVRMLTNLVLKVVKENQQLIENQKQHAELTNKFFEICKQNTLLANNTTNNISSINNISSNKTFNLNVFLNETCKDAMNIMDFVDSLKLQLSDLENIGEKGFVEGISNIIVKNLKAMDVHLRPVHCSDSKREVMYVKDDDRWEKENNEKLKLRKAIKRLAFKNTKLIPQFKEKYPDCGKSHSTKSDQYNKLIVEAMGGLGDNDDEKENKIIKKIAKEVIIDKQFELV
jgi:hypothetical protein